MIDLGAIVNSVVSKQEPVRDWFIAVRGTPPGETADVESRSRYFTGTKSAARKKAQEDAAEFAGVAGGWKYRVLVFDTASKATRPVMTVRVPSKKRGKPAPKLEVDVAEIVAQQVVEAAVGQVAATAVIEQAVIATQAPKGKGRAWNTPAKMIAYLKQHGKPRDPGTPARNKTAVIAQIVSHSGLRKNVRDALASQLKAFSKSDVRAVYLGLFGVAPQNPLQFSLL